MKKREINDQWGICMPRVYTEILSKGTGEHHEDKKYKLGSFMFTKFWAVRMIRGAKALSLSSINESKKKIHSNQ